MCADVKQRCRGVQFESEEISANKNFKKRLFFTKIFFVP